jgi:DNA-binding GntR family transcriptional regulator
MLSGARGIRPARRAGLADGVAESIRQAIFDGALELGQRLSEADLAQQLGVSRGPVREALVQLKQEGIVTITQHRGASVVTFSAEDVSELASLRMALELFAVELAVARASDADLDDLAEIAKSLTEAAAAGNEYKLVQLDVRFHDGLYRAAHHDRLWKAWATIRSQVLLFLLSRRAANDDYRTVAAVEHQQILDILRTRDADEARHVIQEHLRGSYDRLIRAFPDKNYPDPPAGGTDAARREDPGRHPVPPSEQP